MTSFSNTRGGKGTAPFCQATGCFDQADVYVVLKETEEPACSYDELRKDKNYEPTEQSTDLEFDGFKLILYLCARHDNDFNYLIKGSELGIAKRCYLKPAGLRRVQPSSK